MVADMRKIVLKINLIALKNTAKYLADWKEKTLYNINGFQC